MGFRTLRLHYRDADWKILEEKAQALGSKDLGVYIKKQTWNITRKTIMDNLLSCDCSKRARVFTLNDGIYERLERIARAQCIPIASLVGMLVTDPLLAEAILNKN